MPRNQGNQANQENQGSDNVPRLRFPGFQVEWKKSKLKEITNKIQDGTHFSPTIIENGSCMYLTSKNIRNGYMDFRDVSFISQESHNEIYKRCEVKYGDILITKDGANVGNICINTLKNEFSLLSSVAFIRSDSSIASNEYIYHYICSPIGQTEIKSFVSGQAITRITLSKLSIFKISFPSLPEQQKIASFLTTVDEKLQALKKKKTLLEQYKKGIMQKIFSQERRFKDDNGKDFPEWETSTLGDCLNYEQPTEYLVTNTEYDDTYETPVLTAGKTFILGYTNETYGVFNKVLPVIIFDDFTTAIQFVSFPFKAKSSAMKILIANNGFDIKFLYEAMKMIKYDIGGHERHWISKFSQLEIQRPSFPEQTKIANFLTAIDDKINHCQTQIEKTEMWKKGLLQRMFC